MKKVKAIFLLLSFLTFACAEPQIPNVSPIVPTDTNYCSSGCEHLQSLTGRDGKLSCEESRPLHMPSGEVISCERFCKETQDAGRNLYPSCWLEVTSCDQIEVFRLRSRPCK